ncbi:uncharacterized protein LOC110698165 [Chenopodium quinoa]|uniref:uncharacterized protein LOC110698165 n=1 Tax=Chenopodium quinoa TaxID=63459 RepID=UPI000B781C71|nr:uncharacterized protein LOC110698165 [Chenopodium quinoa]
MFCEVVELEFSKTIIPKKDIELFFFPVFEKDHYYLVCFNTTTDCGTIEVIDYSEGPRENKKLLKNLKSAFSYFMNGEGSIQSVVLSKQIKSMESVVVDLPWKSSDDNHLHCGVAMMRHMETYMGLQKWNSGLNKNNDIIIEKLRLKYTLSIISSEVNTVKQVVQKKKKAEEASDAEES